jgi:hypothetical protein
VNHATWLKKLLLVFAALVLSAGAAHAQASRTWVSGVGDDANPCSRTAPCKTFAGAISKTLAGGEINCLDSGGFGAVTITKSISIICEGVTAGVLAAGTNGVIVNVAATDRVLLQGLDIEGLRGSPSLAGIHGVHIVGGGRVTIRKSSIRNFNQYGVHLVGLANARVMIEDSYIAECKLGGLFVQGNGGVSNNALVNQSVFDNNGDASVIIAGPGSIVLSASTLRLTNAAIVISGGGTVISYGDNVIRGTGTPTTTLPRM